MKMICDEPDNRSAAESAELAKLTEMVRSLDFHGVLLLSKPCDKCNGLHKWRMISSSTMPGDHVKALLLHAANDMIVDGGVPFDDRAKQQ